MRDTKIILFDIGGVVVTRTDELIYHRIADEYGLKCADVKTIVRKSLRPWEKGNITGKEHTRRFHLHVKKKGKPLHKIWDEYYQKIAKIDKDMIKLVDKLRLKGYIVGALSNTIYPQYIYNKKRGLFKHFKPLFMSNLIGMKKPFKNIYLYVINKLKVKPKDIIFIDDKLHNVKGAKSAGIDAILFKNKQQLIKDFRKRGIEV